MPVAGVDVGGGVGVGDVVLGLRLAVLEQPLALLDAQGVLGAAAGEDVVRLGVDRVGHESGGERAAGIGVDLVPVVRWCRGTRRADNARLRVGVQLEGVEDTRRDAVLESFQPKGAAPPKLLGFPASGPCAAAIRRRTAAVESPSGLTGATHGALPR